MPLLCENVVDGTLAVVPENETWRPATPQAILNDERRRFAEDHFIGSMAGKTIPIFGGGPQLKTIRKYQMEEWSIDSRLRLAGVNAAPMNARVLWGLPDVFDFLVAADEFNDAQMKHEGWEWDGTRAIKFRQGVRFGGGTIPFSSSSEPTGIMRDIFWNDSIGAAISLALMALATAWRDKRGIRHVTRAEGGRIVLIGVEHNNNVHAVPKDTDKPDQPWGLMESRFAEHREFEKWSRERGARIYQSCPTSLIQCYESIDLNTLASS